MKAILCTKYGSPEDLLYKELEKPVPKDDEILVRVCAASVNDFEWGLLRGKPYIVRLFSGLFQLKKPVILGCDMAGKIEAVGKEVKDLKPGDAVYCDLCDSGFGAFAEYTCVNALKVVLIPEKMSFPQAAAIPQAGTLAVQGLEKGNLRDGIKILINGAGGGVGTQGIHLTRQYKVETTAVDKGEKLALLSALGYDHTIDYTEVDFTRTGQHYDLILDVKTNRSPFDYLRALNRGGIYVTVGGSMVKVLQILLLTPFLFLFASLFKKKRMFVISLKANEGLEAINALFRQGEFFPTLDKQYSLEDVPAALNYFWQAKQQGKVIINIPE